MIKSIRSLRELKFPNWNDWYHMKTLWYHIVSFIFKHDDKFLFSGLELVKDSWDEFKHERPQLRPSDMDRAIEDIVKPLCQLAEDLHGFHNSCEHTYYP